MARPNTITRFERRVINQLTKLPNAVPKKVIRAGIPKSAGTGIYYSLRGVTVEKNKFLRCNMVKNAKTK